MKSTSIPQEKAPEQKAGAIPESGGNSPAAARHDLWRSAVISLAIAIPVLFGMFWEASIHSVLTWYWSATFNHGFLILPIVLYLIWLRRAELAAIEPRPNYLGLLGLALSGLGWLVADAADVILVQQFALVAAIQCMTFTIIGWRATRVILFPLAYLFFAVPFGEFLVPPLQDLTADFTVMFLRFINIPVFLDGIFLSIPNGNFEVAEACSGVRFLIAIVALGTLFAYMNYYTTWRQVLFVALSFVVPIIANGFRAFGIVYIGYVSDMKAAVGADHIVYGWVFFAIVTVALLALGAAFREPEDQPAGTDDDAGASSTSAPRRNIVTTAMMAVLVIGSPPTYAVVLDRVVDVEPKASLTLPADSNGWRRIPDYKDSWKPDFPGANLKALGSYAKNGKQVHLFMAYYGKQKQGAELVSEINSVEGGTYWNRAQSGNVSAIYRGAPLEMKFTRMRHAGEGRMVWQWYWVDGAFTSSRIVAKLREAKTKLLGQSRAGAAIVIASDFTGQRVEAETALRDFLASIGPIRPMLERVSGK